MADLVKQPDMMWEVLAQVEDEFVAKLVDVSKKVRAGKRRQQVQVLVLRTDYMVDRESQELKMVEYNTVATSLGCLCQRVREIQDIILKKYNPPLNYSAIY